MRWVIGLCLWMAASVLALPSPVAAAEQADETHDLTAPQSALELPALAAQLLPPLPFQGPQVGPIIKQGFPDDVTRWTTAFIPGNLDQLTPIQFPEEEQRWIRVDLSEQMVIAYDGDRPVRGFVISSGLPRTPTVTGTFRILVQS